MFLFVNFQDIPPPESSKALLDMAFRKAREKGEKKLKGNWLEIIRKKESLKLDVIKDNLFTRMKRILNSFPGIGTLSPFYVKLMKLTLDYPQYKKSLGAVNWALQKIAFFHKQYVGKINRVNDRIIIKNLSKQFYGRASSILKQIDSSLKYLNECRNIMRSYPDIKEMFTVCIYGFPNVGKTTLLNKLAGSKAKVAPYAFTTKGINVGYLDTEGKKIQLLDVPGSLARKDKMNNIELIAHIVAQDLADMIIYVFDPSETSGFSVEKQEQLLQNLGKSKPLLIYLSKVDLVSKEAVEHFKEQFMYEHCPLQQIGEKIIQVEQNSCKMPEDCNI